MSSLLGGNIDVVQILLGVFFLFFVGLIVHLRAEDKREGYPCIDPADGTRGVGFPPIPRAKIFRLMDGGEVLAPRPEEPDRLVGRRLFGFPGAPMDPQGDPLLAGIGPAAFVHRRDEPLIYKEGEIQVLPMRSLEGWRLGEGDPDPRGMRVIGADRRAAGLVTDVWIDRSVKILRYIEIETGGAADERRRVLLPIYHADIRRRRGEVRVRAAAAPRFTDAPVTADPDRVTAREEDQVNAFWAGARFYRDQAVTRTAA